MRISEITCYSSEDLSTFTLFEDERKRNIEDDENWEVVQTSAFKRGFRKYRTDPRVMAAFYEILDFIYSNDTAPPVSSYPDKFFVHPIVQALKKELNNSLSTHLKGQKIIMLFRTHNREPKNKNEKNKNEKTKNKLELLHLGTHQDVGWR